MKGGSLLVRILVVTLVAMCAWGARAQIITADISGTVTDPSGAVITNAMVTVTSTQTGLSLSTTADKDGLYRIHGLQPGTYDIRGTAPGFETYSQPGVVVSVNQQLVVNISLTVGSSEQTVTVTEATTQVETTTAQISNLVTERTLEQLPLNGRDLFSLTLLEPGVVPTTNAGTNNWAVGVGAKAASQGTRLTMSNVTSDGSDINDPGFNIPPGGPAGVQLGVEATEEFRVVTSPYNAEYGHTAGANVQYVTKSGTNELHGSLYEFLRNSAFDARNYFDVPKIPHFERNQFGMSLGGPIKKNKLFLFGDFESLREMISVTEANVDVPDANARAGFLPSATNPNVLVNVGVNPLTAKVLPLYPACNGAEIGGGICLWNGSAPEPVTDNFGTARADYNITSKDQAFVRFAVEDGTLSKPAAVPGFPLYIPVTNYYSMISWQHEFSNTVLNQAKINLNRTAYISTPAGVHGVTDSLVQTDQNLGTVSATGLTSIGYSTVYPLGTKSNVLEGIDNLSWDRGAHSLKFGADVKRLQINGPYSYGYNGSYAFSSAGLLAPARSNAPGLEALLLGQPATYTGANPLFNSDRYFRQNYFGFYAQDDYRVSSRLTLNLGLRWEYWSQISEKYNRQGNIMNIYTTPSLTLNSNSVWASVPKDLWSPRIGFAWQPFGTKTSIRGGYGLMRDQIYENIYGDIRLYLPYYQIIQATKPNFLLPPTSIASLGGSPVVTVGSYGMTYTPKWPYYHEFSLDIEHQLTQSMLLRVGYVGTDGVHLLRTGEANPVCEQLVDQPTSLCTAANIGKRLNPNFGSTPLVVTDATSHFNALETSLQERVTNGLQFQVSYTWSHNIDTASSPYPSDYGSGPDVTQNYFNLAGDKGPANTDRRNVFVANYVYDLPFGPGKKFAGGTSGLVGKLIGGWQWTGILSLEDGPPFTVVIASFNNEGTGVGSTTGDRPNVVPGANQCANTSNPAQWFSPSIYTLPTANTFGDAVRNGGCGPGIRNIDTALMKQTAITERVGLQFRAEFFNAFNTPDFQTPTSTGAQVFTARVGNCNAATAAYACGNVNPSEGRITSTTLTSRQIQFALKLTF
jgi:hypothetical protein